MWRLSCQLEHQSPRCLERAQYLDGGKAQEAAGFGKQGGEMVRMHDQHLRREERREMSQESNRQERPRARWAAILRPMHLCSTRPQGGAVRVMGSFELDSRYQGERVWGSNSTLYS